VNDDRCKHELVREQCVDYRVAPGTPVSMSMDGGASVQRIGTVESSSTDRDGNVHIVTRFDDFVTPTATTGHWFEARYSGRCGGCGEWFDEGDPIRADGAGTYLAECCGGDDA
jgi:hypothetical protein